MEANSSVFLNEPHVLIETSTNCVCVCVCVCVSCTRNRAEALKYKMEWNLTLLLCRYCMDPIIIGTRICYGSDARSTYDSFKGLPSGRFRELLFASNDLSFSLADHSIHYGSSYAEKRYRAASVNSLSLVLQERHCIVHAGV